MKKVLIFGFSHCGTTILKCIIGHIDKVFEVIDETMDVNIKNIDNKKYDYALIKYPQLKDKFLSDEYKDFIKIFIIRNPLYVFSSINKRKNYNLGVRHSIEKFISICDKYVNYLNNHVENLFLIKYEDIFKNKFSEIKKIFDKIGFNYSDKIFNNKNYINKSFSKIKDIPKDKPNCKDHNKYRTYQINLEFKNMNNINNISLKKSQYNKIINSKSINLLYPNIKEISVKNKIL